MFYFLPQKNPQVLRHAVFSFFPNFEIMVPKMAKIWIPLWIFSIKIAFDENYSEHVLLIISTESTIQECKWIRIVYVLVLLS